MPETSCSGRSPCLLMEALQTIDYKWFFGALDTECIYSHYLNHSKCSPFFGDTVVIVIIVEGVKQPLGAQTTVCGL